MIKEIKSKAALVQIELEGKDTFDCVDIGEITWGKYNFEQDLENWKTFLILLIGIWPNL